MVCDDAVWNKERIVTFVALVEIDASLFNQMAIDLGAILQLAFKEMCVRIHQQLIWIESNCVLGLPRTVHPISIPLPGANSCKVAVPDRAVAMGEGEARLHHLAVDLVEEAELDSICSIAPDSEVATALGDGGTESSRICWKHGDSLPSLPLYYSARSVGGALNNCETCYSSVTSPHEDRGVCETSP